jgi:glucose/arabinose dehydrogenase
MTALTASPHSLYTGLMLKACFLLSTALLLAADQKLPAPYATPSAANPPKVVSKPDGRALQVPAGFSVEEYASGFQKPRYLLALPTGGALVSDSVAKGSVIAIVNGQKKTVLSGLSKPFGMALWKDYLYVTEDESIKRYKFNVKTLEAGMGEEVISLKGYTKGHWTRTLQFDKTGQKLYVAIGSGSNIDAGDPKDRAAVNIYNPDGTGHEVMAGGLRNPVGIRFNPVSGKLWTTVQERDGLGDDLVPDYFTEVKPGAFYGWPYAYVGPNEEPRRKGEAPELVAKTVVPDVLLPPHSAVMDFVFYTGKKFPAKYHNGAFLAYRGSSNRSQRVGYSVAFIPFKNGKPAGPPEDFMTGWMMGPDQKEVWGRPVGLCVMRDGSLLVSEDANNTIWRIFVK